MKTFDGKTVLTQLLAHDVNTAIVNGNSHEQVIEMIENKLKFLKNPQNYGCNIRWWDDKKLENSQQEIKVDEFEKQLRML